MTDLSLLGWKVKDKLTGFTGIVQGFIQYYGGVLQADVQAIGKETNKIEQAYYMDLFQLEKIGKAPVLTDLPKHNPLVANLGDQAQDIVTGITGTVVAIKWYLNGCTKYEIAGKIQDLKKPADSQASIDVLEARVKLVKALKKEAPKTARTGGPTVPSKRF